MRGILAGPASEEVSWGTSASSARGVTDDEDLADQMLVASLEGTLSSSEARQTSQSAGTSGESPNIVFATPVHANPYDSQARRTGDVFLGNRRVASFRRPSPIRSQVSVEDLVSDFRTYDHTEEVADTDSPRPGNSRELTRSYSSVGTGLLRGDEDNVASFTDAQTIYKRDHCIFVANLSDTKGDLALEAAVTRAFSEYGIVHVKIKRDGSRNNMPYAFCQYTNQEDAIRAFSKGKNVCIFGRSCRTEWAKKNRFFMVSRNDDLPCTILEARHLLKKYGQISRAYEADLELCEELKINQGIVVEFAYYTASRDRDIVNADHGDYSIKLKGPKKVKVSREDLDREFLARYDQTKRSIYVSKLPTGCDEEELGEFFTQFGAVRALNIVHPEHAPHPFAFVEFDTLFGAEEALTNKSMCEIRPGHLLNVQQKKAETRAPSQKTSNSGLSQKSSWSSKSQAGGARQRLSPGGSNLHLKSALRNSYVRASPNKLPTIPGSDIDSHWPQDKARNISPRVAMTRSYMERDASGSPSSQEKKIAGSSLKPTRVKIGGVDYPLKPIGGDPYFKKAAKKFGHGLKYGAATGWENDEGEDDQTIAWVVKGAEMAPPAYASSREQNDEAVEGYADNDSPTTFAQHPTDVEAKMRAARKAAQGVSDAAQSEYDAWVRSGGHENSFMRAQIGAATPTPRRVVRKLKSSTSDNDLQASFQQQRAANSARYDSRPPTRVSPARQLELELERHRPTVASRPMAAPQPGYMDDYARSPMISPPPGFTGNYGRPSMIAPPPGFTGSYARPPTIAPPTGFTVDFGRSPTIPPPPGVTGGYTRPPSVPPPPGFTGSYGTRNPIISPLPGDPDWRYQSSGDRPFIPVCEPDIDGPYPNYKGPFRPRYGMGIAGSDPVTGKPVDEDGEEVLVWKGGHQKKSGQKRGARKDKADSENDA